MSYAIAQVIYGIPLHSNEDDDEDFPEELEDALEAEEEGFLQFYSGGSIYTPAAFGVKLCEFDEACDHVDVSELKLEPTKEQWQEYEAMFKALPEGMKIRVMKYYDTPRTFILWSTS